MATRLQTVDEQLETLSDAFEMLVPDNLDRLIALYDDAAQFKNPFNDVCGRVAIRRIFLHLFETLDRPRFMVHEKMASGNQAFMAWEMHFRIPRLSKGALSIRGTAHVRFSVSGQVLLHRDYWDASEEFYEKVPALGYLMRWLKSRTSAG